MPEDDYARLMRELAEAGAEAQRRRDEARQWYERQRAAAEDAVRQAQREASAAARQAAEANADVTDVDAEAAQLWSALGRHLGASARKLGEPPAPAPPGERDDPHRLLDGVRELLDAATRDRTLPRSAYPVLVLFGVLGAGLAAAIAHGLRIAGREAGGELGVGLPVVALIVALLGAAAGLVPAKRYADRRGAGLDTAAVAAVVLAGLVTAGVLLAVLR
jgi:hypothetical protein